MENQLPFEKIKRELIVKRKAETSPKYGIAPEKRPTEELITYGVVNIDKPKGPTSHQVSAYVQQILGLTKAGHSGTLDPGVTGVLPIALGRATRISQYLLTSGKEYVGIMHLHKDVDEATLRVAVADFVGKIMQLPPIKSAVKRQLRERSIYYFEVLEIEEKDVLFRVGCQAGTYIRKLCHDLGQKLGCGAHMTELRRTKAAAFDESTLFSLQDLADAFYYYKNEGNDKYLRKVIMPVESAIAHIPRIWVLDTTVESLCHGANLKNPGIVQLESGIEPEDDVAILSLKGELICLGKARLHSREMMQEKGIAVSVDSVFMQPGTYPKVEKKN